jgi:hypothetical protein
MDRVIRRRGDRACSEMMTNLGLLRMMRILRILKIGKVMRLRKIQVRDTRVHLKSQPPRHAHQLAYWGSSRVAEGLRSSSKG